MEIFQVIFNRDIITSLNSSGRIKHRTMAAQHSLIGIQLVSKICNLETIVHTDEESIRCNSLKYESLDCINLNSTYIAY